LSRQTSPPGKSFNERWPDDVATANYLARPWVPIALGGCAGIAGLPLVAAAFLLWSWTNLLTVVAAFGLLTFLASRTRGSLRVWILRLWRLTGWLLLAGLVGYIALVLAGALCGTAICGAGTGATPERVGPSVVVFVVILVGSVFAAVAVDRAARRLPMR
jgi:hypothetical protein